VAIAQDPAHTSKGVFAKLTSWLVLSRLPQGGDEAGGRAQSVGVIVA
jgi:hypothetical protein